MRRYSPEIRWHRSGAAFCFVALLFLTCYCSAAHAEDTVVQTSLLGRVESKRLTVGSSVFVKTVADWHQGLCRLRDGDTLEARVVAVEHRTPASKHESIALRFLPLTCAGNESQEIVPILVAISAKPHETDTSMLDRATLLAFFTKMVGAEGRGGAATSPGQQNADGHSMSFSRNSAEDSLYVGEVSGFPGTTLQLPNLTLEPTTIQSSHEMLFDPEVQFFLLVRTVSSHPPDVNVASSATHVPGTKAPAAPPATKEPQIVESCVNSGCKLADLPALHTGVPAEQRLSLRGLGYKLRNNRILLDLGEDATVDFLGHHQLLVTFGIHPLIERSSDDKAWETMPRIVRALVISASDGRVLHAEDWHVENERRYLWPLDRGRVLAAVGGALTIFGPDLTIEQRWPLPGPLSFVRVSPSRGIIAAVVIKERHTPEEHRRLVEFAGPDRATIAEDYELTVLDGHLNSLGTKALRGNPDMPAILDTGILVADSETRSRWKLKELLWNGKQRTIVEERSACPLRVSALPTNLILLAGCTADASHPWYRIVRPDGKTLLKGTTSANGWLEDSDALTSRKVFAIGILEATRPVNFDDGMYAREFQKLDVSVYSSTDGRRLYATGPLKGTANRQSFALSEDGDRLAILSGEELSLYRIDKAGPLRPEQPPTK